MIYSNLKCYLDLGDVNSVVNIWCFQNIYTFVRNFCKIKLKFFIEICCSFSLHWKGTAFSFSFVCFNKIYRCIPMDAMLNWFLCLLTEMSMRHMECTVTSFTDLLAEVAAWALFLGKAILWKILPRKVLLRKIFPTLIL